MRIADEGPTTAVMNRSAEVDDTRMIFCCNLKTLLGAIRAEKNSSD
jgi:hypothetical protein